MLSILKNLLSCFNLALMRHHMINVLYREGLSFAAPFNLRVFDPRDAAAGWADRPAVSEAATATR